MISPDGCVSISVYPEEAKSAKIQGRVTLKFTVNTDGSVSDVKILHGVNRLLDAEACQSRFNVSRLGAWNDRREACQGVVCFSGLVPAGQPG